MVEISRDGRRVYFTNSLYGAIDEQFYPEGIKGWTVKLDAHPQGGIDFDEKFFVEWPKSHHPIRLGSKVAIARRIPIAILEVSLDRLADSGRRFPGRGVKGGQGVRIVGDRGAVQITPDPRAR